MLSIIVAKSKNNTIGGDNKLLWHISEDLKRFKEITSGSTIIMGRKTFESLPGILPNRKHIILTNSVDYSVDSPNVEVFHSLNDIIHLWKNSNEEAFVIGGGEIYKALLPHCNKLYLTIVDKDFSGDTFFPEIDLNQWKIEFESEEKTDEKSNLKYKFIDLIR
ncbi:dihydrofolate reductase [Clostridium sp.]|uniref:dihydrofolate reductase n=1 Tax=Clostridium sp. TaxID=1506 RepID=UPI003F3632FB